MDWPSSPVLLPGVPAATYHADAIGDAPTLSRSIAHMGITVSWRHAAAAHPRLAGTITRRESKAMDHGSLVHALLLGGEEAIVIVHYGDFRTNAAKEVRDAAYAAGKTPILEPDLEDALVAVEILKPAICQALADVLSPQEPYGVSWSDFGRELTCLYEDEVGAYRLECDRCEHGEGEPFAPDDLCPGCGVGYLRQVGVVRVRQRWDLCLESAALLADLKVVTGGRWAQAAPYIRQLNSEADSGAMQAASYLRGLAAVHSETAGRGTFVFLRAEPYPPYSVVPIVVTEGLRQLGEERWMRGVAGWAKCMASGIWPGPGVAYAQAESWAVERELQHTLEGGGDAEA